MTDFELIQKLNPDIAEDYLKAIELIKLTPRHSLIIFRDCLSYICDEIAKSNNLKFYGTTDNKIKELFSKNIIDFNFKSLLDQIRLLGNKSAHKNYTIIEEDDQKFIEHTNKQLLEDAERGRYLIIDVAKKILNLDERNITLIKIDTTEYQQIIYDALTSSNIQKHLKAGLLCEAIAENEKNKITSHKVIPYVNNEQLCYIQNFYKHAISFYQTSFNISAKLDQKLVDRVSKNTDDIVLQNCDLEPLYRYSKILYEELDGSNQKELGLKYLKIACDRKHPEATAYYAVHLYNEKKFDQVLEYANKDYVQELPLIHRLLCEYYSNKEINFIDNERAFNHIQKAIQLGCSDSLFQLGQAYHNGTFVEKDDQLAEDYLRQAISKGNINAKRYYLLEFKEGKKEICEALISEAKNFAELLINKNKPLINTPKIGRNDPCPCKSGKKYKKCCGKIDS